MDRSRVALGGALVALGIIVTALAVRAGVWTWPRGGDAQAASATTATSRAQTVSVVAEGDAPAAPNTVSLQLGVAVHRPTVRAALDRAGVELGSVVSALRHEGVADADIQTDSLNLSADYTNGSVTGYAATSMVRVTIHHVQNTQGVISAAADAAGNDTQVQGITYSYTPDAGTLQTARQAAMSAAHTQAEQWARLAGRHLGDVVSVSEAGASTPQPQSCGQGCGAGGAGGGGVPVLPGVGHVAEVVTVVYALTD
jgi:uncharacterized protein YggE